MSLITCTVPTRVMVLTCIGRCGNHGIAAKARIFFAGAISMRAIRTSAPVHGCSRQYFFAKVAAPLLHGPLQAGPATRCWPAGSGNPDHAPECNPGWSQMCLPTHCVNALSCCSNLAIFRCQPQLLGGCLLRNFFSRAVYARKRGMPRTNMPTWRVFPFHRHQQQSDEYLPLASASRISGVDSAERTT